jgi:hypothetical protein
MSKVKFALGLKSEIPINKKQCSQEYWNKVVSYFGNLEGCTEEQIQKAKNRKDLFKR